ncbi:aldose epimerase family protein [Terrilactibacillus laevilacticus]|uniref:Aldose epimerase n=1 Tax=Terrilactibacillus laevilacticus TaxID=1380157 RepID=A0ABW5PMV2_9BACI|nr:aldose epimerase [Terrilactibacillus laevilacticus]
MKTSSLKIYEIKEEATQSSFKIAPERGGMITSLILHGQECLYMDEESLHDEKRNVRGGIPVLFPICDRLRGNRYKHKGKTYTMYNHGFARNLPWTIEEINFDTQSITLSLESGYETKRQYPFDFKLTFQYTLKKGKLQIRQQYKNLSDDHLPFYAGFHPYFNVDHKVIEVKTDATKYFDVNDGKEKTVTGTFDLTETKEALTLLNSEQGHIRFPMNAQYDLMLWMGKEFRFITLWSEPGKDYVCVEPWMARPNAMNTKDYLHQILQDREMNTYFEVGLVEKGGNS